MGVTTGVLRIVLVTVGIDDADVLMFSAEVAGVEGATAGDDPLGGLESIVGPRG